MQLGPFIDKLEKAFSRELRGDESLSSYIEKINQNQDLSPEEASTAMRILMSGRVSGHQQKEFLAAMYQKKPVVDEIAAFAYTLRKLAEPVRIKTGSGEKWPVIGDTCGTGGGTFETFNISTAIMFILASAGIIVAKHGNRSITSKCGSADVLEELGVNINLGPKEVEECIRKIKIGFIYAPNFHKAFKNVQKVRKELSFPTVFNILGPLANPAFDLENTTVKYSQVLGVNKPQLTGKIAEVLRRLNVNRAMVVHGFYGESEKGMDELSTIGKTKVSELKSDGSIEDYFLEPGQFGFKQTNPEDLSGGERSQNAKILVDILKGIERGPKRDIVLLNAAAGLYVGGKTANIKEGIKLAEEAIASQRAYKKLEELIKISRSF